MLFTFIESREGQTVFRNEVTGLILTACATDLLLWHPDGGYHSTVVEWNQYYAGRPMIYVSLSL